MSRRLQHLMRALASLWLTLVCLAAAAAIALTGGAAAWSTGLLIAVPFAILCVNLMAAIVVNEKLRAHGGLLIFHLALATLAMLAAVDRLTSLSGHVEVAEGSAFDASLVEARAGPLHHWALDRVRFVQDDFVIHYAPGMRRRDTVSRILVPGDEGTWREVTVGDDTPLIAGNYRFYTSFNKGFAPVLTYTDRAGLVHRGSVHLPLYPLKYYNQGNEWRLPDGSHTVKLWLNLPESVYDENTAWTFNEPENAVLVVIDDARRHELQPGDTIDMGGGKLRYEALRSWMGYTIAYNAMTPWMVAAVLIAVIGLAWHVCRKLWRRPARAAAG